MHLSSKLQSGLFDLAMVGVFGGWFAASLKMRKVYLGRLGWLSWVDSPRIFWGLCAGLSALAALFAWFLFRLIAQG
ncbi:hypothetical protein [uncultured Caulobacter sp.]|uniref:hypothetical protein n=1 Tax=uncultured Caulobacter sp. TaxID=158749 RepID=UPI00261996FC|nr:hypothetical protein [uncultured Caulobacter sp.]